MSLVDTYFGLFFIHSSVYTCEAQEFIVRFYSVLVTVVDGDTEPIVLVTRVRILVWGIIC